MTNLVHDIATYNDMDKDILNVVIEIVRWSSNKIEYSENEGIFRLDRVLHHQMFYPFDYGFLPQTLEGDGDPIDVVMLTTYPTFPGCVIKARVIGMIETEDDEWQDMKLICVPIHKLDPRRSHIKTTDDLNPHVVEELLLHFKEIKKLEKAKYDKVKIGWLKNIEESHKLIKECMTRYQKEFQK